MASPRRRVAQQRPDPERDYTGFPHTTLNTRGIWFRNHTVRDQPDHGAWWFATSPAKAPGEQSGRFDLPEPEGTCYLASTAEAAVFELIGPGYTTNGWIDTPLLADRVLSTLRLTRTVNAADVSSDQAATYRVTNELTTMSDYAITQDWARTLHQSGFNAIVAALRFSPGPARGLALFGDTGAPDPDWPGDPHPVPILSVVRAMHIDIIDVPHSGQVHLADPPTP